jgi:hypothetical protein
MKLVALPVFLTFFLAAALVVNFSSAVLLYLLFNFLIVFIIFWSYKPCKEEIDELWLPLLSSCGDAYVKSKGENESTENAEPSCDVAGDICVNIKGENDNNDNGNGIDNDDERHSCSDGCNEDDDNNGSAAEIGWQDVDEEIDENLEKRIEVFIAKVNYGWREEMLRDQ